MFLDCVVCVLLLLLFDWRCCLFICMRAPVFVYVRVLICVFDVVCFCRISCFCCVDVLRCFMFALVDTIAFDCVCL